MPGTNYEIELTDTFGGEANYSWVRRGRFHAPDNAGRALLVRRGKKALNLTRRHVAHDYGDTIELRFPGACVVAFISHKEWTP